MGTAFPASASAGRYFFSSAAVNDRSSDRRCVMSRASARSRSEPLASSTPRASSCRTKSSNRSEASASRKVKRLYPMSLTRVSLTQHPGLTQRDRARFQRDLDRSGLERTQRGIGFGRTAELNSCQKNQPDRLPEHARGIARRSAESTTHSDLLVPSQYFRRERKRSIFFSASVTPSSLRDASVLSVERGKMGRSARAGYAPVHQLDHCHKGTMSYPRYRYVSVVVI